MKSLLYYNMKLLFSPLKWLCCLIFIIIIPICMFVPTYYDFNNICEFYMPFIGITLITDITLIDKNNGIEEILYVSSNNLKKNFFIRYFITVALIICFILLANIIFFVQGHLQGKYYLNEQITTLQFLLISVSSTLLLGTISMTIGNFLSNQYIAYGISLVYWIYWNVNYEKQSIFNLFPFVSNPREYIFHISMQFAFIIFLCILNGLSSQKSRFYSLAN